MTDAVQLFLALLSLIALAGTITVIGAIATGRRDLIAGFAGVAVPLSAAVAIVATLGSLYFSEVAGYVPCRLCWVQRGFMYPMAVILGVAAYRSRVTGPWRGLWKFIVPWSLVATAVSAFHYAEQQQWIGGGAVCSATAPCSDQWVSEFGFISIPFMAFCGFAFIAALMWLQRTGETPDQPTDISDSTVGSS